MKKHGAEKFWRRGILPAGKRTLGEHTDRIIHRITADLGGGEHLTGTQGVLLAQLRKCLIFTALVDEWLGRQTEFVGKDGDLPPALSKFYLSAMNSVIRICSELGLERKVSRGENLEDYLKKKYPVVVEAGKPGAAHGAATVKQSGYPSTIEASSSEIVAPGATGEGIPK